ncbi:hypothetical protein CRENBAI_007952 [Crenichthys baileyi]|uniref:Uncharacterized protein n=1 Tax=Crenichthys baileyi TaxID=28760 RepID=A0AAV9QU42_9TELE
MTVNILVKQSSSRPPQHLAVLNCLPALQRTFGLTKPSTSRPRFPNKAHHPDRDPASELVLQARTKTRLPHPIPQ